MSVKMCRSYHTKRSIKILASLVALVAIFILAHICNLSEPFHHSLLVPAEVRSTVPADVRSTVLTSSLQESNSMDSGTTNRSDPVRRRRPVSVKLVRPRSKSSIVFKKCKRIPEAPAGTRWPEEEYLHDPAASSIMDIPDPILSRVWLDGPGSVKVGDTVKLNIHLYNGRNETRKQGGDVVRVWIKEDSKGAKTAGHVTDNQDGSYSAIITAFWEGQPEIQVAIISPREVTVIAMKRRYTCPPVFVNTAIFQHPVNKNISETTPCNYDNFIAGYSEVNVCNLTQQNYDRPWYCGKPRDERLTCEDWTWSSGVNLWQSGLEQRTMSSMERKLTDLKYAGRKIHTNITLKVTKDDAGLQRVIPRLECSQMETSMTWDITSPTGYFYNNTWTNRQCKSNLNEDKLNSCLENTTVILIGDSTIRQMFEQFIPRISCELMTGKLSRRDKRPGMCANASMNYSLAWKSHSLPFCSATYPRDNFKSQQAYLNEIQGPGRFVIVLHLFLHLLNYHSHVFYETLKDLKKSIISLLDRNLDVSVVIKGPHAYSLFSNRSDYVMRLPAAYAITYQQWIYDEFKDLREKVVYLNCMDITVSSDQLSVHPEDYIVKSFLDNVFSFTCR